MTDWQASCQRSSRAHEAETRLGWISSKHPPCRRWLLLVQGPIPPNCHHVCRNRQLSSFNGRSCPSGQFRNGHQYVDTRARTRSSECHQFLATRWPGSGEQDQELRDEQEERGACPSSDLRGREAGSLNYSSALAPTFAVGSRTPETNPGGPGTSHVC